MSRISKDKKLKEQLLVRNSRKRQKVEWIFYAKYDEGTYIRAGLIHNKSKGNPFDIIIRTYPAYGALLYSIYCKSYY
jgi:hypothetical protein